MLLELGLTELYNKWVCNNTWGPPPQVVAQPQLGLIKWPQPTIARAVVPVVLRAPTLWAKSFG